MRFVCSSATEIVLTLVQHDTPSSDAVQCEIRGVNGHVDDAPIPGRDVAQISTVTTVVVQSPVVMCAVGIVVTSHARTSLGHVAMLVHVKPVQPVGHPGNTHIAKRDVYATSFARLAKRDSTTPEGRGKRHFSF